MLNLLAHNRQRGWGREKFYFIHDRKINRCFPSPQLQRCSHIQSPGDVQLDGKIDQKTSPLHHHGAHKRIYFYFSLPTYASNFPFEIHNVSALSFIGTRRYLFEFSPIYRYRSIFNGMSFLYTHELTGTVHKVADWFPWKWLKYFTSGKNKAEQIIRINGGENWQFSYVHDENELHLLQNTWSCIQRAISPLQVIKMQWKFMQIRLQFNLNFKLSSRWETICTDDLFFGAMTLHEKRRRPRNVLTRENKREFCVRSRKVLIPHWFAEIKLDWIKRKSRRIVVAFCTKPTENEISVFDRKFVDNSHGTEVEKFSGNSS